uniref:Transmembrane protein n=1 Tax=Anopheles minimus TaxID=112268 RepID=A0A182WMR3_9DIPT
MKTKKQTPTHTHILRNKSEPYILIVPLSPFPKPSLHPRNHTDVTLGGSVLRTQHRNIIRTNRSKRSFAFSDGGDSRVLRCSDRAIRPKRNHRCRCATFPAHPACSVFCVSLSLPPPSRILSLMLVIFLLFSLLRNTFYCFAPFC